MPLSNLFVYFLCNLLVGEVEEIVNLALGNYKGVTFCKRIDVEECVELFVLCNFVAMNGHKNWVDWMKALGMLFIIWGACFPRN